MNGEGEASRTRARVDVPAEALCPFTQPGQPCP